MLQSLGGGAPASRHRSLDDRQGVRERQHERTAAPRLRGLDEVEVDGRHDGVEGSSGGAPALRRRAPQDAEEAQGLGALSLRESEHRLGRLMEQLQGVQPDRRRVAGCAQRAHRFTQSQERGAGCTRPLGDRKDEERLLGPLLPVGATQLEQLVPHHPGEGWRRRRDRARGRGRRRVDDGWRSAVARRAPRDEQRQRHRKHGQRGPAGCLRGGNDRRARRACGGRRHALDRRGTAAAVAREDRFELGAHLSRVLEPVLAVGREGAYEQPVHRGRQVDAEAGRQGSSFGQPPPEQREHLLFPER